ncbi:hypothetical protein WJX77_010423 [Trebouxia sp. C0004]
MGGGASTSSEAEGTMHRTESCSQLGLALGPVTGTHFSLNSVHTGDVLPKLGLATTPQQASQASALTARFGSWFPSSRIETTAKKHQAGNWILRTVLLRPTTETVFIRPRHQPAEARAAEAVAPCQESAPGGQADHNRQRSACVVDLQPMSQWASP